MLLYLSNLNCHQVWSINLSCIIIILPCIYFLADKDIKILVSFDLHYVQRYESLYEKSNLTLIDGMLCLCFYQILSLLAVAHERINLTVHWLSLYLTHTAQTIIRRAGDERVFPVLVCQLRGSILRPLEYWTLDWFPLRIFLLLLSAAISVTKRLFPLMI